jgi:hypothetical protein
VEQDGTSSGIEEHLGIESTLRRERRDERLPAVAVEGPGIRKQTIGIFSAEQHGAPS